MKKIIDFVVRLYRVLIGLYPGQYRDEFGDELAGVFTCMLNDSAREGSFALLKTCLRELWDLPGSIVWAHIRSLRGGYMKTWMNSQLVQFSLRSGVGIGASYLAMNVFGLFGRQLLDFSTVDSMMVSMLTFILIWSILFTLIFGFAMSTAFKNLHSAKYFFLLGLGWGLVPHLLDMLHIWAKLSLIIPYSITSGVAYVINGALLGVCLNPWPRNARKTFQFVLAGGVGLPLARVLAGWLLKPIYVFMGISSSQQPVFNTVSALTGSVYWAVVGLLLGALLGVFVQWLTSRDEARAVA